MKEDLQLPLLELALGEHRAAYGVLLQRWQQIEAKVTTYIVTLGILFAALAVTLQVQNLPSCVSWTAVISLASSMLSMFFCLRSLQVQDLRAPPSAAITHQRVIEFFRLPSREERVENFYSDIVRDWQAAISATGDALIAKAKQAKLALGFLVVAAIVAIAALIFAFVSKG
jgi:hypothetical protein